MQWTSDNVVDWIISLDRKYEEYEEMLRNSFNEQEVNGKAETY